MGLLAVCDLAVAASTARFGLPEVKVGLFPMQVAALLQTLLPPRPFAEMCYTGAVLDAAQAQAAGLINRAVAPQDLDSETEALLTQILANSPAAIRRGKHALTATAGMTFDQALAHMEAQAGLMTLTEDAREGLAAFAQKRPPVWTGR
jgi:enoyl-CoA hydratase/carnithine racemase